MRRLAAILLSGALIGAAAAAAATPVNQGRLDRTVRFLQEAQNPDGGFGGEPGEASVQGISAWVALALAAAGINPQDQRKPGGTDVYSFLVDHFRQGVEDETCHPEICTTALERELMVVNASGTSPHAFGAVDLVAELLARQRHGDPNDGAFPFVPGGVPAVNTTVFAILGLVPVAEPEAQAAIGSAADWLEAAQQASGGWSWKDRESPDEVDMTGAAIQALVAAGRGGSTAVIEGLEYLEEAQNGDGGFPEIPGDPESNVASTAWATQAIWAVGQNPEDWRTESGEPTEEPLDYLGSMQEPDGHLRWKHSQDLNGIWMTAYAAPAFAGQVWPIPAPARQDPPGTPPASGDGGGTESGRGVIAGGGGNGAPLFSRPQPQSKGRTPGGARLVHNHGPGPVDHSKVRRGANARQPSGSEEVEPARNEVIPEPASVSTAGRSVGADGGTPSGRGGGPTAGQEVRGTVIGSLASARSSTAFGAPGPHGAGVDEDEGRLLAIGVGALALLAALGGARWERRREAVL
jgi:squalene-hopene cyclase-like protein/prenyltransferase/squalene oxidase-like repeat protein